MSTTREVVGRLFGCLSMYWELDGTNPQPVIDFLIEVSHGRITPNDGAYILIQAVNGGEICESCHRAACGQTLDGVSLCEQCGREAEEEQS